MREYVTVLVKLEKEEWLDILAMDVFEDTDDVFEFIKDLELKVADVDLCLKLADYFNKEAEKIKAEEDYG